MSTRNRRATPPLPSSRASIPPNTNKKVMATKPPVLKKRTALCDVTNQRSGSQIAPHSSASSKPRVPCATKVVKRKNGTSAFISSRGLSGNGFPESLSSKSSILVPHSLKSVSGAVESVETIATDYSSRSRRGSVFPAPSSILHALRSKDVSPVRSVNGSVSLDESMSTSSSLKTPESDHIDSDDILEVKSVKQQTENSVYTQDTPQIEGTFQRVTVTVDEIVDIDNNLADPQFCATISFDIYKYLLESEVNRRPSIDFMETVQNDIDARMRAVLVDWLVEVAEEFKLLQDTLFLACNYVDRYLSGNAMKKKRLQLLGVACMLIAAKYEEIHVPEVEDFCNITDNTYSRDEILQMEFDVVNHLKFEMAAPTAMCFLRRFCLVAERTSCEVSPVLFQCLAHYIAELSLLEYSMLGFAPSLIAASATLLAKYILSPSTSPWNSSLRHYTNYRACDLCDCVKVLHHLCFNGSYPNLTAVREKYCQHEYKFVAKKYCPPSIPPEFFHDSSN